MIILINNINPIKKDIKCHWGLNVQVRGISQRPSGLLVTCPLLQPWECTSPPTAECVIDRGPQWPCSETHQDIFRGCASSGYLWSLTAQQAGSWHTQDSPDGRLYLGLPDSLLKLLLTERRSGCFHPVAFVSPSHEVRLVSGLGFSPSLPWLPPISSQTHFS